jgi:micrococcal nuclease
MIKFAIRTVTRIVVVSVMFSVFANPEMRIQAMGIARSVVSTATAAIGDALTDAATKDASNSATQAATDAATSALVDQASTITIEDVQTAASSLFKKSRVVRVIDGDTFVVRAGTKQTTVRIVGVNAPESVKKDSPVECFGPEASQFLKQLLPKGKVVLLKFGKDRTDKYGRTLAYVSLSNGTDVQRELLTRGYARVMAIKPNTTRASEFAALENDARNANVGLWAACS